jgi:hypothetical protein
LREAAALRINTMQQTFLPKRPAEAETPHEKEMKRLRFRYFSSLRNLHDAGTETGIGEHTGALEYPKMRWKSNP